MGDNIDFSALNRCQKIQKDAKIDLSTIKYFGVPITSMNKDQLTTCLCHSIGTNLASVDIKQAVTLSNKFKAAKQAKRHSPEVDVLLNARASQIEKEQKNKS